MKNDFVSSVSHELRTPLASIKAYVEMLIDGEADDEKTKREFYEVIQNEANRLGRLIDNILNISRIESGLVKVNRQPQSLTVIVKDAIEVITPQATEKHIMIDEQLTPVIYQTVADRDMLYQAILNLLSNAVKYTPEGGTITVETAVDEARKKVIMPDQRHGRRHPAEGPAVRVRQVLPGRGEQAHGQGDGAGAVAREAHRRDGAPRADVVESEVGKGSSFGFELDLCE